MTGWAGVEARRGRIFVTSYSQAGRAEVLNGWLAAADGRAEDREIGRLVRTALSASQVDVSFPDFRAGPPPELRKLLEVAGVNSFNQYARGTRSVRVALDDRETEGFTAVPYRNEGPRHGFVPMDDQTVSLKADADDAQWAVWCSQP
jgi:hypothetical protein